MKDNKRQSGNKDLRSLLPRGSMVRIARAAGVTKQAVQFALKNADPRNPHVKEAVRLIREAGTAETARELRELLGDIETVSV